MNDLIASNIMSFSYGSLFTFMLCLWFRNRAEHKLRTEHRKELDRQQGISDAERYALQGAPHVLSLALASPYRKAFNEVGLTETLKLLKNELELLSKRVLVALEKLVDARFAAAEQLATVRNEFLAGMIAKSEANVLNAINFEKRLAVVEEITRRPA